MATVADWPDCARCKRPMTMVDSRECADGPVWRCLKCPTPDGGRTTFGRRSPAATPVLADRRAVRHRIQGGDSCSFLHSHLRLFRDYITHPGPYLAVRSCVDGMLRIPGGTLRAASGSSGPARPALAARFKAPKCVGP
jgi:hypothetical protein